MSLPDVVVRDGFDEARVPVTARLLDALTGPHEDAERDRGAARDLAALVEQHLDRGSGLLVLTGLPARRDAGERAVLRVTRLLGEALPQDREGTLVREVRDRGTAIGEGLRARYSDSRFGGDLHTDGAESALPAPDVFTLFCVRQADEGGALQVVHVRTVLRELAGRPEVLETLHAAFEFDRRGDQLPGEAPTVRKPVLFSQLDRPAVSYLRSYVERGHAHPGVAPLNSRQRAALDALDQVIADLAPDRGGKLRPGELALFDNLSLLHGRTEFRDQPDHTRLLLRTWVRRQAKT